MIDADTIDPALEDGARRLLADATRDLHPSPRLDVRVGGLAASDDRWRRRVAIAASFVLLTAVSWAVLRTSDTRSSVIVRDSPSSATAYWWTEVGPAWTALPSIPGFLFGGLLATREGLTGWEADGGDRSGPVVQLTLGGQLVWDRGEPLDENYYMSAGIIVDRPAGPMLAAITQENDGYHIAAVGSENVTDLGPLNPFASHLGTTPVLLRGPKELGGEAWVFSHVDGDASKGLEFSRVGETERSGVDRIEVPNLRPLAVGVTPAGEPMILTQVIASTRVGSMVTLYAQVDGVWLERGSTTFAEAEAVWADDRFVMASNQAGETDGPADLAVQFTTGASAADTRWDVLDSPKIGSCESPIELIEDGTGGVVATSCGVSAFLPSASKSWRPVPVVDGLPSTFLVAAWDGRLIAEGLYDEGRYDVEGGTSPLMAIDMNP